MQRFLAELNRWESVESDRVAGCYALIRGIRFHSIVLADRIVAVLELQLNLHGVGNEQARSLLEGAECVAFAALIR